MSDRSRFRSLRAPAATAWIALALSIAGCKKQPPPVAATEDLANQYCNKTDRWEECLTECRRLSGEDTSGKRGPVQRALELAVTLCEENEGWPTCLEKIRPYSEKDKVAEACKATPKPRGCR